MLISNMVMLPNTSHHKPPDARHALTPYEHALTQNIIERSATARLRSISKGIRPIFAQYYPRHAFALCRPLFMHLHEASGTALGLALTGETGEGIDMRNHALYACSAKFEFKKSHCNSYSGLQKNKVYFSHSSIK